MLLREEGLRLVSVKVLSWCCEGRYKDFDDEVMIEFQIHILGLSLLSLGRESDQINHVDCEYKLNIDIN